MHSPPLQPDETGDIPSPFAYLNPESKDWQGADDDENDGSYEGEDKDDSEDDEGDSGWGLGVLGIPVFPILPTLSLA